MSSLNFKDMEEKLPCDFAVEDEYLKKSFSIAKDDVWRLWRSKRSDGIKKIGIYLWPAVTDDAVSQEKIPVWIVTANNGMRFVYIPFSGKFMYWHSGRLKASRCWWIKTAEYENGSYLVLFNIMLAL